MNEIRKRNAEIVRMRRGGATYREIAERFERSPSLPQQVVRRFNQEEEWARRSSALLDEIRQSNDLERKWETVSLVTGLLLPGRVTKALLRHFAAEDIRELSLRELMDMIINDRNPDEIFGVTVGLRITHIGKYSFRSIVKRLLALDLGRNANREWARRIEILKRH